MTPTMPVPALHFAHPPYRAERVGNNTDWSGVMNRDGVNVLTFPEAPGVVFTTLMHAEAIAAAWNASNQEKTP